MKKVVRLTESQLKDVIKRVISEQAMNQNPETPGEDAYEKQVSNQKASDEKFKSDLKKNNRVSVITFPQQEIMNKKTYTSDKVSRFEFKIDDVTLPANFDPEQLAVPPRTIKLKGMRLEIDSENPYEGKKYKPIDTSDSYNNPFILVSYLCKRNKENLKVPLDYKARAETVFNGMSKSIDGILKKETVEFIENNWCSYQPE
jgi:hypothetical protein